MKLTYKSCVNIINFRFFIEQVISPNSLPVICSDFIRTVQVFSQKVAKRIVWKCMPNLPILTPSLKNQEHSLAHGFEFHRPCSWFLNRQGWQVYVHCKHCYKTIGHIGFSTSIIMTPLNIYCCWLFMKVKTEKSPAKKVKKEVPSDDEPMEQSTNGHGHSSPQKVGVKLWNHTGEGEGVLWHDIVGMGLVFIHPSVHPPFHTPLLLVKKDAFQTECLINCLFSMPNLQKLSSQLPKMLSNLA